MRFTKAQGCDLYYEDKGHGIPILLIHPAGATASTWGSVAEAEPVTACIAGSYGVRG